MPLSVKLRPWSLDDLMFTLRVRNHPLLMKFFRQDEPIGLEEQKAFIEKDLGPYGSYNGQVIEVDGEPVGLCGVKSTGEFTLGLLPEHQHKGIATEAMKTLLQKEEGFGSVWSEVFVGNPALEFFVAKCGFKITGVKERAYYKQGIGLIDVIKIQHE